MVNIQEMIPIQKTLRRRLLEVIYREKLSHLGSCLSALDVLIAVYALKKEKDKFVLSNGHAGFALYVILEHMKLMDLTILKEFNIHPDRNIDKGIHVSTGSLGQGLPIALGMALGEPQQDVYCLISDGECAEGSIWEAIRITVEKNVKNLKIIVNVNGWAAYMPVDPKRLKKQFEGFGMHVIEVNGHSLSELETALKDSQDGISIIFAKTHVEQFPFLKGLDAHYYVMNTQNYHQALEALQ